MMGPLRKGEPHVVFDIDTVTEGVLIAFATLLHPFEHPYLSHRPANCELGTEGQGIFPRKRKITQKCEFGLRPRGVRADTGVHIAQYRTTLTSNQSDRICPARPWHTVLNLSVTNPPISSLFAVLLRWRPSTGSSRPCWRMTQGWAPSVMPAHLNGPTSRSCSCTSQSHGSSRVSGPCRGGGARGTLMAGAAEG